MSVLARLKRKQVNSSLLYYQLLINKEQGKVIKEDKVSDDVRVSRNYDIKVIDKNKENQEIQSAKTRLDVNRRMMMKQLEDNKKNTRIVSNNSLDGLKAGFLDSVNKEKYIKDNSVNFKSLVVEEQRVLYKLFLDFL